MTKKRGANSPMESERTKQSTSAAASTLGMAAMLSAVSSVFSNNTNDESSQNSESEEEYSQATGGDANLSSSNPWNNENLSNHRPWWLSWLERLSTNSKVEGSNPGKAVPFLERQYSRKN